MKYKGVSIDNIVIYRHPLLYIHLSLYLIIDLLLWLKNFIIKYCILIVIAAILWGIIAHLPALNTFKQFIIFAIYWIVLGIASSIGLGTGLHTFVLYLGPHIAKVTIAATACNRLPEMVPSRWNFQHFENCQANSQSIGFFSILLAVQLEAFLWGLGTAIGELPPYFVAKKASQTNENIKRLELEEQKKQAKTNDEKKKLIQTAQQIDQINYLKTKTSKTLLQKAKVMLYDNLQKYGFITILLCASIPNPLFDLAGITCGHFRISFKKFFTATFIGKAIIKVHIQMLFVITCFRKQTVKQVINFLSKLSQGLADAMASIMEKQKQTLYKAKDQIGDEPLLGRIWGIFIILMVGYFVVSIITSEVQEKAVQNKDKQ